MANLSIIASLVGHFVVPDEDFWSRLEKECEDHAFFDAQGSAHERIDLRLVDKIHALFEPDLGDADDNPNWWHNLECYGDGIRSLSMNIGALRDNYLAELQGFLEGEHEPFCILVQLHDDFFGDADTKIGAVAIFARKAMISSGAAQRISAPAY